MAEPKCPDCAVEGIDHIRSKESRERSRSRQPWFLVVYCNECGHVYEILAKHVFSNETKSDTRFVLPNQPS